MQDFPTDGADDLAALQAYSALYTDGEPSFEAITFLLREAIGTEMAMLSLTDEFHQLFRASHGLSVRGVPHDIALCAYMPQCTETLMVEDTNSHRDLHQNPIVTGAPFVRSFLGAPIKSPDGTMVGTIAAAGTTTRGFNEAHRSALDLAAGLVTELVSLRNQIEDLNPTPVLVDRRRWDTMLQAELASGGERPIVGLAEVDNFQEIAKRHGSEIADAMLDWIMECATEMTPPDGRLSRLGESSFGFTLPDMSAAAARKLVRNLQEIAVDIVAEVTSDRTTERTISCVLSRPGLNEPVNLCWDRMMMGLDQAGESGPAAFIDLIDLSELGSDQAAQMSQAG